MTKCEHNWMPYYYDSQIAVNSNGNYANYKLTMIYCPNCNSIKMLPSYEDMVNNGYDDEL